MNYPFLSSPCPCLKRVLGEVRNLEQAQEIRLTDGMPDIGRVLCGWGQILQRSKEWNGDSVSLSAGMMVWVLYAPEDGSETRIVEGWIPFSISWDLPESVPEGRLRIHCLTRFVDARNVSARKIMVRVGIGAMAEAFVPYEAQVYAPQGDMENIQLKKSKYPLRIPTEAGEKLFSLEETLDLPPTVPPMEKLILSTMDWEISEQRVMTDKAVFKGSVHVHILYKGSEGKLHSWDFSVPFSQFAELETSCSQEAQVGILCGITGLETEQTDGNSLILRASLTAQYLIEDQKILEIVEDAYRPGSTLELQQEKLEMSRTLEQRRDSVTAEAAIPGDGEITADAVFLPDFPRYRKAEGKVITDLSGTFQVLYYGGGGELQSAVSRWEDQKVMDASQQVELHTMPLSPSEPQIFLGGGDRKVRAELPLLTTVEAGEGMAMVTGLAEGEDREPDPARPSLILKRAGDRDLWDLAKESGSTMDAIREANHLEADPVPGQMLLIPIL